MDIASICPKGRAHRRIKADGWAGKEARTAGAAEKKNPAASAHLLYLWRARGYQ
jgi:hypothetical protein